MSFAVRDIPLYLLVMASSARRLEGVEVRIFESGDDAKPLFARISEALKLIGEVEPSVLEHLRRDTRCLLLTSGPGGHFLQGPRICRLGIESVIKRPTLQLAMLIVHEATHARLWGEGRRFRPEEQGEAERLCVQAEVEFAAKVPNSEAAIATVLQLLNTEWWTDSNFKRNKAILLRNMGCPEWLLRIFG
jgi:hypothetical protein